MKLNGVHLFVILLLSLLMASFLGKVVSGIGYKEGNTNPSSEPDISKLNQHTGGDSNAVTAAMLQMLLNKTGSNPVGAPALNKSQDMMAQENRDGAPPNPPGDQSTEAFGGLFDNILPSNVSLLEPFLFPSLEGLENKSDSGSKGITQDQIPPGQEHLYILKSQVVPPSCPISPAFSKNTQDGSGEGGEGGGEGGDGDEGDDGSDSNLNLEHDDSSGLSNGLGAAFRGPGSGGAKNKKCPPCPACARCPEPSFECKKVPNYSIGANGSMSVPRPVLADFSQFGM